MSKNLSRRGLLGGLLAALAALFAPSQVRAQAKAAPPAVAPPEQELPWVSEQHDDGSVTHSRYDAQGNLVTCWTYSIDPIGELRRSLQSPDEPSPGPNP